MVGRRAVGGQAGWGRGVELAFAGFGDRRRMLAGEGWAGTVGGWAGGAGEVEVVVVGCVAAWGGVAVGVVVGVVVVVAVVVGGGDLVGKLARRLGRGRRCRRGP